MPRAKERLGEGVRYRNVRWDVLDNDTTILNKFSREVVLNSDVPQAWVEDWILRRRECALVVTEDDCRRL